MAVVRQPAVAGMFYPGRADELSRQVSSLLEEARSRPEAKPSPLVKALIAPHAGYVYSGPTAAIAYAALAPVYDQVVLAGPCHRVGTPFVALPGADSFRTPLGDVPVWADGVAALKDFPGVIESPEVHAREHSLEVHLPFIQMVLGHKIPVLPLAVGWSPAPVVADILAAACAAPSTLLVVSSDLSHYLPYARAREVDQGTLNQITALAPDLVSEQACGVYPVNGLSLWARQRGLTPRLLDYRNSGDTAGDRSGVVGYAAVIYQEEVPDAV
jgi:AmmeMemoRadiSam system protein B